MKMLSELQLFVAVINHGNLSAAGREFYLSPASISNKISALEDYYDAKLLVRTTRKIEVTKAGEMLYQSAVKLLEELNCIKENIQANINKAEGLIRLTIPFDLGEQFILPILDKFSEINPKVKYDILFTDDIVSYNQFPFDIAIRQGNLQNSNFIAKKLIKSYRILCASPKYLKKMNITNINDINILKDCDFITIKINGTAIKNWYLIDPQNNKLEINLNPSCIVNNGYISRKMCLRGYGIASKSYWDIKKDLDSGELIQILPDYKVTLNANDKPDNVISLIYPYKQFQPYRVRMLNEFIINNFPKNS
ncbi:MULTISPECIES: LysR family transcriptional regulator [unclassified Francisella]|uniref:LysR family transcriptional regulator n=1 Tax=unclassified Francisella TaxID=2610885 RepID=UPI002E34BB86|nr:MULTISPECIES: LysR family transcriptional regulator [unclassified Francisella]MED7819451.1 LysR family transcriptional regulator [Francisella sp. 19S2-4]MED7830240.1 LysR family transcriptional regulator [Francisella sp. 19S2-10]